MLPDFVRVKAKRSKWFIRALQREAEHRTPMLQHVKTVRQHEGRRMQYDTVEGDREIVSYDKKISTALTINVGEIAKTGPQEYLAKAKQMAEEAAKQQMGQLFSMMDENCKKAGTSTDAGGRPFTAEMLLAAWEEIDIDFDELGRPRLPTIVVNPKSGPTIAAALAEADKSPEMRRRFNDLMQQKWMDWRDREADRKLVD